ncbi:MAG: hypothetical protein C0469_11640 [Cyanobacteria bacterium DS2.3.42]|nr:hypothetical protein [Cyanobacteria bacterium DS2.3.42]
MNEGSPILLGEMLVAAGMVGQNKVEAALRRAGLTGLPLGLELVLQGLLDVDMLSNCVVAQSQVRDGLLNEKAAIDALALAGKKKIQLKVALDVMGVEISSDSKNRLGAVLTDCGLIDRTLLKHCLGLGKATGLPLGRVLIASGVLKSALLDKAVKLQVLLRANEIDRASVLDDLETVNSFLGSVSTIGSANSNTGVDLPSLLLDAKLLEPELANALLCSAREKNIDFEEALFQSAQISNHVTAAAKILLKMIKDKLISYPNGVDLLARVNSVHDWQKLIGEVKPQPVELTFSEFLILTRLSKHKAMKGTSPRVADKDSDNSEMEDTWQILPMVSDETADVSKAMPSDVYDCLERHGFLTAESKLEIATAARQYKLFRHNELSLDKALVTYHLAKQERQQMLAWSGTFPSLAIWLPRVH